MSLPPILVTGGAGYVGSHFVHRLARAGFSYVVVDDIRRGRREAVPSGALVELAIGDAPAIERLCRDRGIELAVHFAAYAYVGESTRDPGLYYENNVAAMSRLLDALVRGGVKGVVFSSSCATFGPVDAPIDESPPQRPVSPYGRTKLVGEGLLRDFEAAYGLRSMPLRYFNAAGANEAAGLCEAHEPETHLIPLALRAALDGVPLQVFGTDYPTPDGTCIRDYVHVDDLADAHLAALERLANGAPSRDYNLGTGRGHSVREVLASVERVTGTPVPWTPAPRREGDPPSLVADPRRANAELDWHPQYTTIDAIVATAAAGERRRRALAVTR